MDDEDAEIIEEPDVQLDVPQLKVDEIDLEVENLRARVQLQAEVLDLLKLNVGADVALGRVKLDIKGVEAQAMLKVRLDKVAEIIRNVLVTIDRNPQILEQITSAAGSAVRDVGSGAEGAVGELGQGAGRVVEEVGESTGQVVEDVGEGAGKAAEEVGSGAEKATESAGEAAAEVGEEAGKAADVAAEGVERTAESAGRSATRTAETAGDRVGRTADDTAGAARSTRQRGTGAARKAKRAVSRDVPNRGKPAQPSPRAREKAEPARSRQLQRRPP